MLPLVQIVSEPTSAKATAATDLHGSLLAAGTTRKYHLHIPAGGEGAAPLVIALHGGGGKASGMNILTHLNEIADRHKFIVCCPEGIDHKWNDGRRATENGVDDVSFVRVLIEQLCDRYEIDRSRVYATGISNGGFLAQRLALTLPQSIAAVASVAASVADELRVICNSNKPVPILLVLGTEDPLIPFQGGTVGGVFGPKGSVLSAAESIDFWVKHNRCRSEAKLLWQSEPEGGMTAKQMLYESEQAGCPVMVFEIEGGGHTWPGGFQYYSKRFIGKTCRSFDASEEIWKFFRHHRIAN